MTNFLERTRLALKEHLEESIEDFAEAIDFLVKPFSKDKDEAIQPIPTWIKQNQSITNVENKEINNHVENNVINKTNTVYQKETIIYQTDVFITNDNYSDLPDKPGSLLPVKEGETKDNQTPTKINIGAPITLGQSISNQSFGKMLYNPFSEDKRIIRQPGSTNIANQIVQANAEGIDKLAGYLADEENSNALDALAIFVPTGLRGLSGKINMLVGTEALRHFIANLTANSTKALMGVSDIVPSGYEVEAYEPVLAQISESNTGVTLKTEEEYKSVSNPAWWQVRLGSDVPQLACSFRKGGSSTYHDLHIPHPKNTSKVDKILLPAYTKGGIQGMVTCKDNSKFIVNCATQEETEHMCAIAITLIQPEWLENPPRVHIGERKGQAVSVDSMIPSSISYYPTGQKQSIPKWRVSVRNL